MKLALSFILSIVVLLLWGCTAEMYYFGKYSETLYDYKREPSEKTMQKHMEELEYIIEESKDDNIRVPPGIYCEYASLLLLQNRKDDALRYVDLEESTYPESRVFTSRFRNLILRPVMSPHDSTINNNGVR